MGEVELDTISKRLIIHADLIFYGNAASYELANIIAADVQMHWNEPHAQIIKDRQYFFVHFNIRGFYKASLDEMEVCQNVDSRRNYFRIEEYATGNISFVDGLNSNTGYFKLDNLLNNSTTAAHEFGHTIGLLHPEDLDIRGRGIPGIMYPRGTIVDSVYQYDPEAAPLAAGGTMNPFFRKVLVKDIEDLKLHRLQFNRNGLALIGDFSSVYHEAHQP